MAGADNRETDGSLENITINVPNIVWPTNVAKTEEPSSNVADADAPIMSDAKAEDTPGQSKVVTDDVLMVCGPFRVHCSYL